MGNIRILSSGLVLLFSGSLIADAPMINQRYKMFRLQTAIGVPADGSFVNGSSARLTRTGDAVWLSINTTGLSPGAYSVWWGIFNNPSACINGCSDEDFMVPEVMGTVFRATGGVVGIDGTAQFRAHLEEGEMPGTAGSVLLNGGPLIDAQKAEFIVVLRYHGPVVERIADKQTSTHYGGCSVEALPFQEADPVLMDRVYPCYDPQAVFFPASQK